MQKPIDLFTQKGYLISIVDYKFGGLQSIFTHTEKRQRDKKEKMMIGKALVATLAVSAMAMAFLQNVEGGRDMALKEAKPHNPQIFNENLGYRSKEDYDCEGYKYKDRDCYNYGTCDKSREECDCDDYKNKDGDCYEYGNCDKSPNHEDGDHQYNWSSYKKQVPESKEVAGKYGVHQKYPWKAVLKHPHKQSTAYGFYE